MSETQNTNETTNTEQVNQLDTSWQTDRVKLEQLLEKLDEVAGSENKAIAKAANEASESIAKLYVEVIAQEVVNS